MIDYLVKEILRQSYERGKSRGFIPCSISSEVASEIVSELKRAIGGLPIRVGLAKGKGGKIVGIWWAVGRKK